MIGRQFHPRILFVTCASLFVACVLTLFGTAPVLAEQFDSGWANPPDVRRHNLGKEKERPIPGWTATPDADARVLVFEPRAPRAFGLLTGDKVRQELRLEVQKPYQLQRSSLPPSQWIDSTLELQDVTVRHTPTEQANQYLIALHYQVFSTPSLVTLESIPGFELMFAGNRETFMLAVPNWRYSISPILKHEAEAESVAEIPLRADAPPQLVDASLPAYGLALFGALSVALGAVWLYLQSMWPFRARGRDAFARACRQLRTLRRGSNGEQDLRDGFRIVHQAFNRTAGEVVFAEQLQRFFERWPSFTPVRAAIEDFFHRSRQVFFDNQAAPRAASMDLASLESLCRQCRAAEREAR